MLAPSLSDPTTPSRPRRPLAPAPVAEAAPAPAVTVTVHINLQGQELPVAAESLFESLRALAGTPGVVVGTTQRSGDGDAHATVPTSRGVGPRPRLVRRGESSPSLRIHLASRMVSRDGTPVRLTRREYDLLAFLSEHPRRVFSRGQLLHHVWGYNKVSGERTVDVHVRRLRVKLGERGPLIATVRGVGYRLDDAAHVMVVSDPE